MGRVRRCEDKCFGSFSKRIKTGTQKRVVVEKSLTKIKIYAIIVFGEGKLQAKNSSLRRRENHGIGEFLELSKTVNLIPPEFKVDRLRDLPIIVERVRAHVKRLRFAKVIPCDVCIENFVHDDKQHIEIVSRIFGENRYNSSDITPEVLEELYPEWNAEPSAQNGRLRVHGITWDGKYQTYCHFCDCDMCLSEVAEGPDWDKIYESQYRDFLPQLPELLGILLLPTNEEEQMSKEVDAIVPEIRGFYFFGSTAWLVTVNLLVEEGRVNRDFAAFAYEGRKWTVSIIPANDPLIHLVRQLGHNLFKPI